MATIHNSMLHTNSVDARVLAPSSVTSEALAPGSVTLEAIAPGVLVPDTVWISLTIPEAQVTNLTSQVIRTTSTLAGEVMSVATRWARNPTPDHMGRWHLRVNEQDVTRNKVVVPNTFINTGDDIYVIVAASRAHPYRHMGGVVDILIRCRV